MDVCVNTVPLADEPLDEVLAYLEGLGVEAVELAAGGVHGDGHVRRRERLDDAAARAALSDLLDAHGMRLCALSTHNNPLHPDPATAERARTELEETIALADRLDVETVVCFSGLPAGAEGDATPNWITAPWPREHLEALEYQWAVAVDYWTDVAADAADRGVRLAFELHPNMLVYEPHGLLRLREATGEAVGANLDPSHLYWQGIAITDAVRLLGEHDAIHFVHAKDTQVFRERVRTRGVLDTTPYDAVGERSWLFRTLGYGHGEAHWRDVVSALRLAGYEGAISVEHEDALTSAREGLEKSLDLLQRVVFETEPGEAHWID